MRAVEGVPVADSAAAAPATGERTCLYGFTASLERSRLRRMSVNEAMHDEH